MKNTLYLVGILFVAVLLYAVNLTDENTELKQTMHAYYTNEMAAASAKMTQLSQAINQAQLLRRERHVIVRCSQFGE